MTLNRALKAIIVFLMNFVAKQLLVELFNLQIALAVLIILLLSLIILEKRTQKRGEK